LVSGLREGERLAPPVERGAVVGVFYGLAYLGMLAPYLLGAIAGAGLGTRGALLVAAGVAAAGLAVVSVASRDQHHSVSTTSPG